MNKKQNVGIREIIGSVIGAIIGIVMMRYFPLSVILIVFAFVFIGFFVWIAYLKPKSNKENDDI